MNNNPVILKSSSKQTISGLIEYKLFENYPNPFNPTTTIRFQIAVDGFVNLEVFDVLGRKIKTLTNEVRSTGSYDIEFDAKKLTSGIYFYKLQTKDFVATKKMLLLR